MVVLSAAICTKSGKALISRQFVEMTRIRIEGLLAAFSKLIGSDSKQHSFIETDTVRYIYQPLDVLYVLLITNRASNIIEDLDTLSLLAKVIPDTIGSANNLTEDKIADKCFDLIFSFDEVIAAGGYKEPVSLQQIRSHLEMESHEEKLHIMILESKKEAAKDQAREAARSIRERQKEQQRLGISPMQGIGSNTNANVFEDTSSNRSEPSVNSTLPTSSSAKSVKGASIKGMPLQASNKNKSWEDALVKEDKLAPVVKSSRNAAAETAAVVAAPVISHPVMLSLVEKASATISRDGLIESFDIKGSLSLTATNEDSSFCGVKLSQGTVDAFAFSTHPKVNKQLYDKSGVLQLKNASTGFPTARPLAILKWTLIGGHDDLVPIKINCWPEEEGRGRVNVSIEYSVETAITLHDVKIKIPLGTSDTPNIVNIDGNYKHSSSTAELIWEIDLIDSSNASGSLEFNIAQKSTEAFFPVVVSFQSNQTFCDISVASVNNVNDGKSIQYGIETGLSSEDYLIV